VVVKLQHVKPAIATPPYAETVRATLEGDGIAVLEGKLIELAGAEKVEVGFELQEYLGFAEAMYNTKWTATSTLQLGEPGSFRLHVKGLDPGTEYQYRVFAKHPKITVRGDNRRFVAK